MICYIYLIIFSVFYLIFLFLHLHCNILSVSLLVPRIVCVFIHAQSILQHLKILVPLKYIWDGLS